MELDEAARRVVRRHLPVVVAMLVVAVLGVLALDLRRAPQYEATATVSATAEAPVTSIQGQAMADRVRTLATLPSVVQAALTAVQQTRDAQQVAREDVVVDRLGSATIVALTVRDGDPEAAAALADALAAEVVRRMDPRTDAALVERLATLAQDERRLRADRSGVASSVADADLRRRQLDAVDSDLATVSQERARLLSESALRPRATVLERPTPPTSAVDTRLAVDLMLAGLLGLVAGLAVATAAEVARPGVIGLRSIAAALSAPSIGVLAGRTRGADTAGVARRLRLLAATRGADTVVIVPVGQQQDHEAQVMRLAIAVAEDTPRPVVPVGLAATSGYPVLGGVPLLPPQSGPPALRVCAISSLQPDMTRTAVAVALTPPSVRQGDLDRLLDTCAASGLTLVGVIGRPRAGRWTGRAAS